MNMIETETAKTIIDICYAKKKTHNKYLPQFFCNNNNYSFTIIFLLFLYTNNIVLLGEILYVHENFK